jgi:hypothetical protein
MRTVAHMHRQYDTHTNTMKTCTYTHAHAHQCIYVGIYTRRHSYSRVGQPKALPAALRASSIRRVRTDSSEVGANALAGAAPLPPPLLELLAGGLSAYVYVYVRMYACVESLQGGVGVRVCVCMYACMYVCRYVYVSS